MHHDKIRLKKEGELYLYLRAGNVYAIFSDTKDE